jgi:fluoroquinolone transport system ATP-binding protein
MISVHNVWHDYSGKQKHAISDVTFDISKGEIFGFLGPSGAGKSTVQNLMTGLLNLQKGIISYEGKSVTKLDTVFFNRVGVSFERPNIYTRLTGYENLQYFAGLFSVKTHDPMDVLSWVGLQDDAQKKAGNYSKGMLQRLSLARALINSPEILFLDEPTSGLDPTTASMIRNLILEQKNRGATVFLTTHNMELADRLCDTVAFLFEGKIAAMDTPDNLKSKYGRKEIILTFDKDGTILSEAFSFEKRHELALRLQEVHPIKIHSQEASLEDIFIRVTGKELI